MLLVIDRPDIVEAVVAIDGVSYRRYHPLLGLQPRVFRLADIGMPVGRAVFSHHISAGLVHDLIGAINDRGLHIITPGDVDHPLRILLALLIARTAMHHHPQLTGGALPVVIDITVCGHELIISSHRLTLAGANESLDAPIIMTIDRGRRPVVRMLAIGQAHTVPADVTELSSGAAVEAPPDADGHAILQAYHRLGDIVHLIVITYLLLFGQQLVEQFIIIHRSSQLVGITPVVVVLAWRKPL